MNGRVYDPTLGRFASADPFVSRPANTQSFNRYSYVRNNPLKYIDPSGYMDVYTLESGHRSKADTSATRPITLIICSYRRRLAIPYPIVPWVISATAVRPWVLLARTCLAWVSAEAGRVPSRAAAPPSSVNRPARRRPRSPRPARQTANGGFSNTTTYYNGAPNGTCICGTGGTSGGATTTVAAAGCGEREFDFVLWEFLWGTCASAAIRRRRFGRTRFVAVLKSCADFLRCRLKRGEARIHLRSIMELTERAPNG